MLEEKHNRFLIEPQKCFGEFRYDTDGNYLCDNDESLDRLKGQTLVEIGISKNYEGNDCILFLTKEGRAYLMVHDQDCCEYVYIEDIAGDLDDILVSEIIKAECVTNKTENDDGSQTYTFYKIDTIKGGVTLRWLGESNGYYSEEVQFFDITEAYMQEINLEAKNAQDTD